MRKAFLMVLLAIVSSNAMAGWVAIGKDETAIIYVDITTIRKNSDKVKMWSLEDSKVARIAIHKTYMSKKIQYEFDCNGEEYRVLTISFHTGNMGGGETVDSIDDIGKWSAVPPESVAERLWQVACGK